VPTYRLETPDGIEHILTIKGEEGDMYDVEATHKFSGYEIMTERYYNKCIFEELLSLGVIIPLHS
jgi:hypothetical protein